MTDPARTVDMIGASEAQEILGIDRATVTRWVASGRLKAIGRIGAQGTYVFDRTHVEDVAAQSAAPAGDATNQATA